MKGSSGRGAWSLLGWLTRPTGIASRPSTTTITVRVAEDVLSFFKQGGSGYQSRMNAVLRAYVYARRERVAARLPRDS